MASAGAFALYAATCALVIWEQEPERMTVRPSQARRQLQPPQHSCRAVVSMRAPSRLHSARAARNQLHLRYGTPKRFYMLGRSASRTA